MARRRKVKHWHSSGRRFTRRRLSLRSLMGSYWFVNGKIVGVGKTGDVKLPRAATILDCTGLCLTAGFRNSHVHFTEAKWADAAQLPSTQLAKHFEEMLICYGFTTVVDTASFVQNTTALRTRVEAGEVAGPRIMSRVDRSYSAPTLAF